jgi:hypothetical protein
MFLSAVLQAHTDSAPRTAGTEPSPQTDDAVVALPERLEKALTLPLQERVQPLPSAHRSRWI